MAARKMTFSIPEDLARQFVRRVSPRERSRFVSEALSTRLRDRDREMIAACKVANADPDISAIEEEWDALPADISEPWSDPPAR